MLFLTPIVALKMLLVHRVAIQSPGAVMPIASMVALAPILSSVDLVMIHCEVLLARTPWKAVRVLMSWMVAKVSIMPVT